MGWVGLRPRDNLLWGLLGLKLLQCAESLPILSAGHVQSWRGLLKLWDMSLHFCFGSSLFGVNLWGRRGQN